MNLLSRLLIDSESNDSEDVGRFLDGSMNVDTIYLAFPWYLSPEGMDFWQEIDKQFRE